MGGVSVMGLASQKAQVLCLSLHPPVWSPGCHTLFRGQDWVGDVEWEDAIWIFLRSERSCGWRCHGVFGPWPAKQGLRERIPGSLRRVKWGDPCSAQSWESTEFFM